MNDLISRQDAIDTVEFGITYAKAINKSTGEVIELFKEGNKALNEAVERLKELPSTQQWIPCSEGSPEDGERVIVQYGDGSLGVIERVRLKIWNLINSPYAKVVAWMPAPEPWKGEKDGNC